MKEKIQNGIIIDGTIYKAIGPIECEECNFYDHWKMECKYQRHSPCALFKGSFTGFIAVDKTK